MPEMSKQEHGLASKERHWKPDGESPTRRKLRALWEQGFTPREAAQLLGVSVQRIYELKKLMGLDEREAS